MLHRAKPNVSTLLIANCTSISGSASHRILTNHTTQKEQRRLQSPAPKSDFTQQPQLQKKTTKPIPNETNHKRDFKWRRLLLLRRPQQQRQVVEAQEFLRVRRVARILSPFFSFP
jgi:hypothetical protein